MQATVSHKSVALITGCSSGFGQLTALALARAGWRVCATLRRPERGTPLAEAAKRENLAIAVKRLDVTDGATVSRAVAELDAEAGRIDLLVNNAGYGLLGAVEDTDLDQIRDQFETNFFGCVRLIHAVMPIFRRQGAGHIINVSSIAGLVGLPLNGAYCASKFALEGLSESLRFEGAMHNVRVSVVEPGAYGTNFAGASLRFGARTGSDGSPYAALNRWHRERTHRTEFADAQEVADLIVALAAGQRKAFRNLIGAKIRPAFLCKRLLGVEITQRIMRRLMGLPV